MTTKRKARKPANAPKGKRLSADARKLNAAWRTLYNNTLLHYRRKLSAKFDLAQTTPFNQRHWVGKTDALSAKEANSLDVRKKLRERSRHEFDNNADVQGVVLTLANQFCGAAGPKLQMLSTDEAGNKAVEVAFADWCKAIRLADILRLMKITKTISGEVFGILRYNPLVKTQVKLDVLPIEPDQVTAPNFKAAQAASYIDGITFDALGNPLTYDVLREHPGDAFVTPAFDTLPSSRVIHWYAALRPGQVRGIPELSASLGTAAVRDDLTMDVAAAYRVATLFGVVLESTSPPGQDEPGEGTEAGGTGEVPDLLQLELVRAMMTELPKDTKASTIKPEHPTATHKDFDRSLLRAVARPACMPYHMAAGDYADSNYATARLGSQDFRIAVGVERTDAEAEVLEVLFAAWFQEASLIPGYLPPTVRAMGTAHSWQWPRWDYIDPQTDAAADGERLEHGSASLSDIRPDWRETIRQRATEEAYAAQVRSELGLGQPAAPAAPVDASVPKSINKRLGVQVRAAAKKQINLTGGPVKFEAAKVQPLKDFSMLAYTGGTMTLPGFEQYPSVVDLAGVTIAAANLPVLLDHKAQLRVGHTIEVVNDGKQITATGKVSGTSPAAREVVQTSRNEFPWQSSIGGEILATDFVAEGQTVSVNGRVFVGPLYVHRQTILREISFVPLGADRGTAARIAAALGGSAMTFEQWVLGFMTIEEFTALDDAAKETWKTVFEKTGGAPPGDEAAEDPPADPAAAGAVPPPVPVAAGAQGGTRRTPRTPSQARAKLNSAPTSVAALRAEMRAEAAAEQKRQNAIRKLSAAYPTVNEAEIDGQQVNVIEHALASDWTPEATELFMVRASRATPAGPFGYAASSKPKANANAQVLEAALCRTLMLPNIEKHFKPEVLEAADQTFKSIGLQQVLLLAANQNGYHAGPGERIHMHNVRSVLRHAFPPHERRLQAAFTPISLPGIFSTTANKEILEGYMADEGPWREIAGINSVSDFKAFTSYRLLDNMEYEEVGPAGEIPHGTLSEESYTRQAKTYAKMLVLTLQDIVNDDLGAFNRLRTILGAGAMMKLRKVFWTEFLSNASTFWTAARTNYIEGSTTNLGTDGVGLGLGVKAFRQMRSPSTDGSKYIAGKPEILAVPPELESIADAYHQNRNLGPGTSIANSNTHAAKYRPVVVPELSDSTYTGYSTTAWYLLRNPSIAPAVVVSFLDGQQTPVIEDTDADFHTLGVQFRGYHHFGADQAEYLAGVKSKGAA